MVALAASTALGSAAFAANQPNGQMANDQSPAASEATGGQRSVDRDFTKLSVDGAQAIRDVHRARFEIFQGELDKARTDIDNASSELQRAQRDNTSFMKAESELKPQAGVNQPGNGQSSTGQAASTTPIAWLPVDSDFALGEDYVATPKKTAAVGQANQQLKSGNRQKALEALKLSDVDLTFVLEVAPLQKTVAGVEEAKQLMAQDKYYQANQALKGVEDGLRFDVNDISAVPKALAANTAKHTDSENAATQSDNDSVKR
jgi:hypothetical protein